MEYFSNLPQDISLHIFSLLPIEAVSDFALVSKSWKKLIHSSSFYQMHTFRLLRLAIDAQAEVNQKLRELCESHESASPPTQIYQSSEQLVQFHRDLVGNIQETMNSLTLSEQKPAYYTRLANKCLLVWAARARVPGESLLEACGSNQTAGHSNIARFAADGDGSGLDKSMGIVLADVVKDGSGMANVARRP